MKLKYFLFFAICVISIYSCTDSSLTPDWNLPSPIIGVPILPASPYNYSSIILPQHLTVNVLGGADQAAAMVSDNTPADNAITDDGATLGRVLFYDKYLSRNGTIACSSCHIAANGFSDPAQHSLGFEGGTTRRHSMSLVNARFYQRGKFFWDERAATLEAQVLMPLQDTIEMGMTLPEVIERVSVLSYYPVLFSNAFGSSEITSDKIARALAQFVRSMVSVSSKYDISRPAVSSPLINFPGFTQSENRGKRLFFAPISNQGLGCIGCHSSEAFINAIPGPTSNGIDAVSTTDLGAYEANPFPPFLGRFKVPSLKNIALTAPYMHDGRFATLADVVEQYNSGIQNHINLGIALKDVNGNPLQLNLSQTQKDDLLNFLNTLTDTVLLNDPKFSNPFP